MSFDFGKHVGKKGPRDLADPLALFRSLDRRASHTTLRPAQESALRQLHERRAEKDAVLKMPTGTGKSSVGLLYLRAKAAEKDRPVVYLCPTKQLVEQVIEESKKVGVRAHHYPAGQPHPEPDCLSGKAVIVCTYDKLFNARTTFDRADVDITPAAIVLDDAHAGVEEIRDAFTLAIESGETFAGLCRILDGPGRQYAAGRWEDLIGGRRGASSIEIPYWSWREVAAEVRQFLADRADDNELKFVWPHLQDILPWCRCVVSPRGIEIVASVPPVEAVRAYREADHRLFMSATLADDSVLVRELGCGLDAAMKPIAPAAGTFGERLVLVPSLIDKSLNLEWVRRTCAAQSKQHRVVVLCSSEREARKWQESGATVVLGEDVSPAVARLRSGEANFVVFVNRYDGVDLPDDACRILVLDGLPLGQGIADGHDGSIRGGFQARTTYRIEQGMGRAVRSDADYAVVILAGSDLASFTAKPEVRDQMSPDARAQIELAFELPKLVRQGEEANDPAAVIQSMIHQCLSRQPGWRTFYDERVRGSVSGAGASIDAGKIRLAAAERRSAERAYAGNSPDAARVLQEALDAHLPRDAAKASRLAARRRAYFLQVIASYQHEFDKGQALQMQDAAFDMDRDLLRPLAAASKGPRAQPKFLDQAALVLKHYETFGHPNAFLVELERIKVSLTFDTPYGRFEQAMKELAPFIGAEGSRPEEELGEGPDNLLLWSGLSLVIEAKTEAEYDAIPKKDAEQLLHSMEWFAAHYPTMKDSAVPVLVCAATQAAKGVHLPKGTRVLTPPRLEKLLKAVTSFAQALVQKPPTAWTSAPVLSLLKDQALAHDRFVATFTD